MQKKSKGPNPKKSKTKAPKVKRTFTIDRARWRSGGTGANSTGHGRTQLLNVEGFSCCLGQIAQQCGFTNEQILNRDDPSDLWDIGERTGFLRDDYGDCTPLAEAAVGINDDGETINQNGNAVFSRRQTLAQREVALMALFKKYGYKLKFVGVARRNHTA